MFVPTKVTVKLSNENMVHAQGIGIILYHFSHCSIIYPVGPVYYCPNHPSNTISLGVLNFYVSFQKVAYKPLEHCNFVYPQGCYCISPYHTKQYIDYLQIEVVKVNPQRNRNIVAPTFFALSKQNLSHLIHQVFGHVYVFGIK